MDSSNIWLRTRRLAGLLSAGNERINGCVVDLTNTSYPSNRTGQGDVQLGLALSGGGSRAAVFHLGVLKRLAAGGLLENVSAISSVSGGSIAAALVFTRSGLRWPTSSEFLATVYPALHQVLTETPLFSPGLVARFPSVWIKATRSRAEVVSQWLQQRWGVCGELNELPSKPRWLINTTCIQTGKNWRFSRRWMGDYSFGIHESPTISIADAVAASAAVPYVLGSIRFALPTDGWRRLNPANDELLEPIKPRFTTVNLWDGGAYENLGLEPLWKPDRGLLHCNHLIVSDASAPLSDPSETSMLGLIKGDLPSPRLFDITSDQIRALRSRMFVRALEQKEVTGNLLRLGGSASVIDWRAKYTRSTEEGERFQPSGTAAGALRIKTHLEAITPQTFELVARNGFEVADATMTAYRSDLAPHSIAWKAP